MTMPSRRAWACALLLMAPGCGGSIAPPSDPAQARALVQTSLDSWKRGEAFGAMTEKSPPLRVLDPDWGDGSTLVDYELKGDPQPLGQNIQQTAALRLKTAKGKARTKTVNYVVTTGPAPMVARQDIDD